MKKFKNSLAVFYVVALAVTTSAVFQPVLAEASVESVESPVVLLERTSNQVIKILRDDRELFKTDPDRIYQVIDEYILPHLDDVTMAKLALGKNWKIATNDQKRAFVGEFKSETSGEDH